MRKSIHEIVSGSYDTCEELNILNSLFFDKKIVPVADYGFARPASFFDIVDEYFYKWPYGARCIDFTGYIEKLNSDGSCLLNCQLNTRITSDNLVTFAFGNAEFYYNMLKFVTSIIFDEYSFYLSGSGKDFALIACFSRNLQELLDHIQAKPFEIEALKYVVIPNNVAAVAVAESTSKEDTRKSILIYNHFSIKGNIEKKRKILSALSLDFDTGNQREKKSPEDDFCFIVNAANIRHNNTMKDGKSIIDGMANDNIEEVYDLAYRLYLIAKLDAEYRTELQAKVRGFKPQKDCCK